MPIFNVDLDITIKTVVEADDEDHAYEIADELLENICLEDELNKSVSPYVYDEPLTKLSELPKGWDGMCLAEGGDRTTRLKDILEND